MSVRTLQRQVHAACRELSLTEEVRHDIQLAACGKASMRDMDEGDLKRVLKHLEGVGYKPKRPARRKAADRADLRFVHVLWRKLGEAGVLERSGRDGLNAFIRAQFGEAWGSVPADVDMLRDPTKINAVIRALKAWCKRAEVSLE